MSARIARTRKVFARRENLRKTRIIQALLPYADKAWARATFALLAA